MSLKKYWLKVINEEAKPSFICSALLLGWTVLLVCFCIDLFSLSEHLWFQRSGAILCMLAIAAEFRLNQLSRARLVEDLNQLIKSESIIESPNFLESNFEKSIRFISPYSVVVGTGVWAFGDFLTI